MRHVKNVKPMNIVHTIIIAVIASALSATLFIAIVHVLNVRLKTDFQKFRKDFESKNKFYKEQLDKKINASKVAEGLDDLKDIMNNKSTGIKNGINGINGINAKKGPGIIKPILKIDVKCKLSTTKKRITKEQDFCCLLLAKNVTNTTNMQEYDHCLALYLAELDNHNHHNNHHRGCHVKDNKRALLTFCCFKRSCSEWDKPILHQECKACRPWCPPCFDKILYG